LTLCSVLQQSCPITTLGPSRSRSPHYDICDHILPRHPYPDHAYIQLGKHARLISASAADHLDITNLSSSLTSQLQSLVTLHLLTSLTKLLQPWPTNPNSPETPTPMTLLSSPNPFPLRVFAAPSASPSPTMNSSPSPGVIFVIARTAGKSRAAM
jgi:hypothetical protein